MTSEPAAVPPVLLAAQHEGWVELTLNRPERLNAFTEDLHRALAAALDAAADEDCRAVLITGAGRGFCAGQDLGDRAKA
ncbi:enoyl-CoA hydratase/isomerase family protein, partial [Xanthobacter autotrophicus]